MYDLLLSPMKIGSMTVKNRTVMTAAEFSLGQTNGKPTELTARAEPKKVTQTIENNTISSVQIKDLWNRKRFATWAKELRHMSTIRNAQSFSMMESMILNAFISPPLTTLPPSRAERRCMRRFRAGAEHAISGRRFPDPCRSADRKTHLFS